MSATPYKKKLIEVAIPLEAINEASAREKYIRHGHPSTLHLWWARRPLAACRAVLFAQLVDDPSSHPDKFPTEEAVETERKRLFGIIEELVVWENSTNEEVLERARAEIRRSCDGQLPPVYDPFSGGGSIPLEAQRLGLPAYGSDLNPVAVMIGKAMIEIPPKFKDQPPVHPGAKERQFYRNAEGLAEDVKYYGEWMREKAFERIGHLYPQVDLPKEQGGGKATVIAWIWARTVPSPDPAFSGVHVPLVSNFILKSKNDEEIWIKPTVAKTDKTISYQVIHGGTKEEITLAKKGTKAGKGSNFRCLLSQSSITSSYVMQCGKKGEIQNKLIAVIVNTGSGKAYLRPTADHENLAMSIQAQDGPEIVFEPEALGFRVGNYGMNIFGDMFTNRQLLALNTFSDLMEEAQKEIECDASHMDAQKLIATAYSHAIVLYLAFSLDRCADYWSNLSRWKNGNEGFSGLFGRQAIPMVWDFPEINPFSDMAGSFKNLFEWTIQSIGSLGNGMPGEIVNSAAQTVELPPHAVVSTDPPYYDNIGYADLSDYFYYWLKRSLKTHYPDNFNFVAAPKSDELVATPIRHGGRASAEEFFLSGMEQTFCNLRDQSNPGYPLTIYYAFKQSQIEAEGISSSGWAAFLSALISAGYAIVQTWPIRMELPNRMRGNYSNALSNSVVLVCRKREAGNDVITRAVFIRQLKKELPSEISKFQNASITPADMPQSAIGPGIGIFSRYKAILEADDSEMPVKTALQLINAQLDEYFNETQGEFDAETRFALTWFEQHGYGAGEFGVADSIARARGVAVQSVADAGVVESKAGKVRILTREELLDDWDPISDAHFTIWEGCQYLIRAQQNDGEEAAAVILKQMGGANAEAVKELAYVLYDIAGNKRNDAKEATAYNGLIAAWNDLTNLATMVSDVSGEAQRRLDL